MLFDVKCLFLTLTYNVSLLFFPLSPTFLIMVSFDSVGWPGTRYVGQAGLFLTEIHLPLTHERWD